jgi:hypothetical protein
VTLTLPTYDAPAAGWRLADYKPRVVLTSGAATGGKATAYGEQLPTDELWLIDHMVTSCTSADATVFRIYDGQEAEGFLLDGTDTGNFDVGGSLSGLQLAPGSQLLAVWSGATDGSVGTFRMQVRVMRQG